MVLGLINLINQKFNFYIYFIIKRNFFIRSSIRNITILRSNFIHKMVLMPILGCFLPKRKTRFSPYFIGVCELFTTTLFVFFTTATWLAFLRLFTTSHSLISFKMGLLLPLYFSIFLLISSRVALNVAPELQIFHIFLSLIFNYNIPFNRI